MLVLELLLLEITVERLDKVEDDKTESTEVSADIVLGVAVVTVFILADTLTDMAGTDNSVCGINVPVEEARLSVGVGITSWEDRLHVVGTRPV